LKGQGGVDKNDVRVIAGPLMDMLTKRWEHADYSLSRWLHTHTTATSLSGLVHLQRTVRLWYCRKSSRYMYMLNIQNTGP